MDQVNSIKFVEGECIKSYDVKALFTSVPMDSSISITRHKLEQDTQLHLSTLMSVQHIITHSALQILISSSMYYEQVLGAAMGSPMSSMVANLFMEEFETKAINSVTHGSGIGMWMTPLSSKRQNTTYNFYNISIPLTHAAKSLKILQTQRVPLLFWTLKFPQDHTTLCSLKSKENQPTQTGTSSETATTTCLLSIVC